MHRFAIICGLLLVALVPACASDGGKEMAVFTPAPPAGKADIAEGVVDRGALGFDAPADGTFDEDAELHGWHVAARGGAIVGVEITREGTSRDLDTTLWVYGPKDALGYGAEAIAFDDDSGWGRHSRIEDLQLPADGDYLIVVGTYDGQGRGRYRLALRCASSDCAPAAPEACVFGEDWAELPRSPGISIVGERSLDDAAGVEALEPVAAEQVLAAVSAGTFQEPASLADALELVDDGVVERFALWDETSSRAYTAWIFGAGDTTVGQVFHRGTLERVATIDDGFISGCAIARGPALTPCGEDADCASDLRCFGVARETGVGRCASTASRPGEDEFCNASDPAPCGEASGLLCAGASAFGDGMCLPAWMSGVFTDAEEVTVEGSTPLIRQVVAEGLATVTTDVWITLSALVSEGDAELVITLTNPDGTEAIIHDGQLSPNDWVSVDRPVLDFPGDESANGTWTLQATTSAGSRVSLKGWTLRMMSRWD